MKLLRFSDSISFSRFLSKPLGYEILPDTTRPSEFSELPNLSLITGGARSGKSAFAEQLASGTVGHVVYIATMRAGGADGESTARIDKHKRRRPTSWKTIEEPVNLAEQITKFKSDVKICLIDCLSLWLANLLPVIDEGLEDDQFDSIEQTVKDNADRLLEAMLARPEIHFILVTNEVGSGIVPTNFVARLYRDLLGTLNQLVARRASRAWLCSVGLQIVLKDSTKAI